MHVCLPTVMGRKFLLSVHRKNEERCCNASTSLLVSIPLTGQVMGLCVSIPRQLVAVPNFVVSLPLSALTSASALGLDMLHSRLGKSRMLPSAWMNISRGTPLRNLTLCKIVYYEETNRACLTFTVVIDQKFNWKISHHHLDGSNSMLLGVPETVRSVDNIVQLLSLLDSSKLRTGVSDGKYHSAFNHHKNTLHGASSKAESNSQNVIMRCNYIMIVLIKGFCF